MGFYGDVSLPRLRDVAMRNKHFVPYRERVIGADEGRVTGNRLQPDFALPSAGAGRNAPGVSVPVESSCWLARTRACDDAKTAGRNSRSA